MSAKFRACPFCGGKAKKIAVEEPTNAGGYVVTCAVCNASSAVVFPSKESPDGHLQVLWNRRVSDDPAVALGKLGGRVRSEAKTKAARKNARKGGWPKGKKRKP